MLHFGIVTKTKDGGFIQATKAELQKLIGKDEMKKLLLKSKNKSVVEKTVDKNKYVMIHNDSIGD